MIDRRKGTYGYERVYRSGEHAHDERVVDSYDVFLREKFSKMQTEEECRNYLEKEFLKKMGFTKAQKREVEKVGSEMINQLFSPISEMSLDNPDDELEAAA